jgi:hypothetical protein
LSPPRSSENSLRRQQFLGPVVPDVARSHVRDACAYLHLGRSDVLFDLLSVFDTSCGWDGFHLPRKFGKSGVALVEVRFERERYESVYESFIGNLFQEADKKVNGESEFGCKHCSHGCPEIGALAERLKDQAEKKRSEWFVGTKRS